MLEILPEFGERRRGGTVRLWSNPATSGDGGASDQLEEECGFQRQVVAAVGLRWPPVRAREERDEGEKREKELAEREKDLI